MANQTRTMAGKKILLVEDEDIVRSMCGRALEAHGFDFIASTNGAEALRIYRERHAEISLVLSDISMPQMSGLDMFRAMMNTHPHANVILMSGYSVEDIVPEELRKLCSVLGKPFTTKTLIDSVKRCLRYEDDHAHRER